MPEADARCAAVNAAGAKRSHAIESHHNDAMRADAPPDLTVIDSQAPHRCHSYLGPFRPWLQIAQHLEANPAGSWYPAPAPAPESTSLAGSDGDSEPAFRCMGANDDAIPSPDDDAVPFPDMPPPWPRRMGALRSNILGLIE